jgi:MazG family protein
LSQENGETGASIEGKVGALKALEEIVERLRGPGGCPWDREQTLEKMAPSILEEACEAVDAISDGRGAPTSQVREELGDLLLNVLLTARIAEESGGFGIKEVAESISEKLIRRHPHVFGDERVSSVSEVLARWNAIKASEKEQSKDAPPRPPSRLGDVPRSLPALSAALKVGNRAAAVGFDWPDARGALDKVEEEVREVGRALEAQAGRDDPPSAELEHELGDLLFAAVNLARKAAVDPESALRGAIRRFRSRFAYIEARTDVSRASLAEMEALWNAAKEHED